MRVLARTMTAFALVATVAFGQSVTFTGDVQADFAPAQFFLDPGGADVGMPPNLIASGLTQSGWDIRGVGLSYDGATDTMFVGIDTFGIAGDADGDGDPGGESAAFELIGGIDFPNFAFGEFYTFAFDFNDDGVLDVIVGTPPGGDLGGHTCALYSPNASDTAPWLNFGQTLSACVGPVPTSPSAGFQDIEFTIPNFSTLTAMFGEPGVMDFGLHVFLGSLEDGGIGEDFIPFLSASLGQGPGECVPIPNNLQQKSVTQMQGGYLLEAEFGLLFLYGGCAIISPVLRQTPWVVAQLPGQPAFDIGDLGDPNSVGAIDAQIALQPRPPVSCYPLSIFLPDAIPPGSTLHFQMFSYPYVDTATRPYFTSNVLTYVQPTPMTF